MNKEDLKSKWVAAADEMDVIDLSIFEGLDKGRITIDLEMDALGLHIRRHVPVTFDVKSVSDTLTVLSVKGDNEESSRPEDVNNLPFPKTRRKLKINNV